MTVSQPVYSEGYPPTQDPSWWDRSPEPVLEPELAIIDSHHHLIDRPGPGRYLLDEFSADVASGHRVIGSLFVEAQTHYMDHGPDDLRSVGETRWLAEVIKGDARGPIIRGMLGGDVNFLVGAAAGDVIDAHLEAGDGLVRGFRDRVIWSVDPGFRRSGMAGRMASAAYHAGVRELASRGLVLDCWMYSEQLTEFAALVEAVPDVQFVLDHLGGPLAIGPFAGRRPEVLRRWREDLHTLAGFPNVAVKVGGLGLPLYGMGFEKRSAPPTSIEIARRWKAEVMFVIEQFGPERVMLESDFPIDKSSFPYRTIWNAHKRITADFSPSERAQMFSENAMRIYHLDAAPLEVQQAVARGGSAIERN